MTTAAASQGGLKPSRGLKTILRTLLGDENPSAREDSTQMNEEHISLRVLGSWDIATVIVALQDGVSS